jgi:methyl-accepting chemotaxis protein
MRIQSIQFKVQSLTQLSVVLTALVLLGVLYWQTGHIQEHMREQVLSTVKTTASEDAQIIRSWCESSDARTRTRLNHSIIVASDEFASGGVAFKDSVAWKAVNQFTGESQIVSLPKMFVGGNWLGQNYDSSVPSAVVDKVTRYTRDSCTIFQRMNEQGDMLRVCTNVVAASGKRAVGTFIPARQPDGSQNPVLARILQGDNYFGRAWVVDQWCNTYYEPIWDASKKKVTGMLYVGVAQKEANCELYRGVRRLTVGKSGYAFILEGTGRDRGLCVASKNPSQDGKNLWDVRDADGTSVVQSMVAKAIASKNGDVQFERSPWQGANETKPRMKLMAVTYYQPWDWVIGTAVYEDEFGGMLETSNGAIGRAIGYSLLSAAVLNILLGVVAFFATRAITRPVKLAVSLLGRVAQGDISREVPETLCARGDEIGELARSIRTMTLGLRETVMKLADNARTLTTSSNALSATASQLAGGADQATAQSTAVATAAEQLSTGMIGMAAAGKQMSDDVRMAAAAVDQMTASITEVARNAEQAATVAAGAAQLAAESNRRIAELGSAAQEIGKVIGVIQDIAEQTNLLALNATIEAARAGEAGKGFAVVATEVKELARQTASATGDIGRRIEAIQHSTDDAICLINNITEVVHQVNGVSRTIASAVEQQSATTREIARNVARTTTIAQTVAHDVADSASIAGEIAHNMAEVDHAARRTADGAASTRTASEQVNSVTERLQSLVEQFKTSA